MFNIFLYCMLFIFLDEKEWHIKSHGTVYKYNLFNAGWHYHFIRFLSEFQVGKLFI